MAQKFNFVLKEIVVVEEKVSAIAELTNISVSQVIEKIQDSIHYL